MPDQAVAVFLFGKLPTHGDFVSRGLDTARRDRWDAWLAAGMAQAQAALGEDFASRYEAAPVWHFAIEEADGQSAGALAASVDAVGRRFPLVAGMYGMASAAVAARCEDALYDALTGGWDADRLQAHLAAINIADSDDRTAPGWWTEGNETHLPARLAGSFPEQLMLTMLVPVEASA